MSDLVEKVMRAANSSRGMSFDLNCNAVMAKAAIAAVLREMMPTDQMKLDGANTLRAGANLLRLADVSSRESAASWCFQAMLRAFAAEHNIAIGEGKEGEKDAVLWRKRHKHSLAAAQPRPNSGRWNLS